MAGRCLANWGRFKLLIWSIVQCGDLGLGVDALESFVEALQAIHIGNQDVFDFAVVEIGENAQPVVCALLVGQVKPQQFLLTFDVQAEIRVNSLADIAAVFLDFLVDDIEPEDRVHSL